MHVCYDVRGSEAHHGARLGVVRTMSEWAGAFVGGHEEHRRRFANTLSRALALSKQCNGHGAQCRKGRFGTVTGLITTPMYMCNTAP